MITFSFRPSNGSDLALIAASVNTRAVSWNDAADNHDSVANDAFVIPINSARPDAGRPPSATTRRFSASNRDRSTNSPGNNSASEESMTVTRFNIYRTMTSMCLSWIVTPWLRYTRCTSFPLSLPASRRPCLVLFPSDPGRQA